MVGIVADSFDATPVTWYAEARNESSTTGQRSPCDTETSEELTETCSAAERCSPFAPTQVTQRPSPGRQVTGVLGVKTVAYGTGIGERPAAFATQDFTAVDLDVIA